MYQLSLILDVMNFFFFLSLKEPIDLPDVLDSFQHTEPSRNRLLEVVFGAAQELSTGPVSTQLIIFVCLLSCLLVFLSFILFLSFYSLLSVFMFSSLSFHYFFLLFSLLFLFINFCPSPFLYCQYLMLLTYFRTWTYTLLFSLFSNLSCAVRRPTLNWKMAGESRLGFKKK